MSLCRILKGLPYLRLANFRAIEIAKAFPQAEVLGIDYQKPPMNRLGFGWGIELELTSC